MIVRRLRGLTQIFEEMLCHRAAEGAARDTNWANEREFFTAETQRKYANRESRNPQPAPLPKHQKLHPKRPQYFFKGSNYFAP